MGDLVNSFLHNNGFIIIQQNGQRIIGQRGCENRPTCNEIYLSQLPRNFDEKDIIPYLLNFQDICKIRTMLTFSGDCRGFCYIDFEDKMSSIRACALLDKLKLRNKTIKCTISDEDCRIIFVAFNWRRIRVLDMIWELLVEINEITDGKSGIQRITVHDHNPHGLVHCFIQFNEHGKAAYTRKNLRNKNKSVFYNAYFDWKKRCLIYSQLPRAILEIYPDERDISNVPRVNLINSEKCVDYSDVEVMLV